MVQEHGSAGGERRLNEPYGDIGVEIAEIAGVLIDYFSGAPEPLGQSQGMPRSDRLALGYWLSLESLVPIMDVPPQTVGMRKTVYDSFLALHTALPYNEAERQWLDKTYSRIDLTEHPRDALPQLIGDYEDRILMSGVRRTVSGRDLMRRWLAWRRETDEFEGQGSLDQARGALQRMQELLN